MSEVLGEQAMQDLQASAVVLPRVRQAVRALGRTARALTEIVGPSATWQTEARVADLDNACDIDEREILDALVRLEGQAAGLREQLDALQRRRDADLAAGAALALDAERRYARSGKPIPEHLVGPLATFGFPPKAAQS